MNEEKIYTHNDISLSNLDALAKREGKSLEMRVCELSFEAEKITECIRALFENGMNVNEVLALLSGDLCYQGYTPDSNTVMEMRDFVVRYLDILSVLDKAIISSLIVSKLGDFGIVIKENDILDDNEPENSVSYVRSPLADEAYEVFFEELSDARVQYSDSFREACFAVADGKVGYAILPFEEKGGVRIPGIMNLIVGLDLKITAITPVFGLAGDADMKYALISKSFRIPGQDEATDRYLEINFSKNTEISLGGLITAFEYLGASVFRVGMIGEDRSKEDSEGYYSLILKDGGKSFVEVLVFLSLFVSVYTPVGIYENIE